MTLHSRKGLPEVVMAFGVAIASPILFTESALSLSLSLGGNSVEGEGIISAVPGATTIRFNTLINATSQTEANVHGYSDGLATYHTPPPARAAVVSGSVLGRFLTPPNNESAYLTIGSSQEPGPVTISFNQPLDYFGLYWGSVDFYNEITFYNNNLEIGHFTGRHIYQFDSTLVISEEDFPESRFINFTATGSHEFFNRIVLSSTWPAFETDNHAYRAANVPPPPPFPAVPTPALLPSLLGLAWGVFRKR
ncbi:PTPA-CTERM sorting domain-containing protein [Leptothermofonsia sp. ETS-13]|uniref:Npun_F0296 family exosortase-dependent surface protein n=1 Tax=Leptothermofonsia sp. ETS-13 TaxID=3035696 RepID=UPI003BA0363B